MRAVQADGWRVTKAAARLCSRRMVSIAADPQPNHSYGAQKCDFRTHRTSSPSFYPSYLPKTEKLRINEDYELAVGGVLLKGSFPIIREYNGEIEMLDIRSDYTYFKRNTEWIIINHDISLIAAGLAFKQVFQTDIKAIKVYMLGTGHIHTLHKKLTDLERFYTTVASVGRAIQHGIYFPSYNINCLNCAYYNKCVVK